MVRGRVLQLAGGALLAGALLLAAGSQFGPRAETGCSQPYVEFQTTSTDPIEVAFARLMALLFGIEVERNPRVWVEVASDPASRSVGLMHREYLDPDAGMLFIFERPGRAGFWMKDTSIPLSIAFIDVDGTVVDVQDMEPLTLDAHIPPADYLYALEVNVGWFERHGVGPGTVASFCVSAA